MRRIWHPLVATSLAVVLGSATGLVHADVQELVGRPAPEIRARPLHGESLIDPSAYRGRVLLLVFVATWCENCRRLAPELERLDARYRDRGLTILALSHEPRSRIRAHQRREPRRYPTAQCTGRTAIRYHADAVPTLVLVDRQGIVRSAFQGASRETTARLGREVRALLLR